MSHIPGLTGAKAGIKTITRQQSDKHAQGLSHVDTGLSLKIIISNACLEQALLF